MASNEMDIVKSEPIETLNKASTINLAGGGVLFVSALYMIYKTNLPSDTKWSVSIWLIFALIVGAVIMGVVGAVARMYDAHLRVTLALALIRTKGTANPVEAAKQTPMSMTPITFEQLQELMAGSVGAYLVQPKHEPTS